MKPTWAATHDQSAAKRHAAVKPAEPTGTVRIFARIPAASSPVAPHLEWGARRRSFRPPVSPSLRVPVTPQNRALLRLLRQAELLAWREADAVELET